MKTEIIEKKGRRFAVVPLKDFEALVAELQDFDRLAKRR